MSAVLDVAETGACEVVWMPQKLGTCEVVWMPHPVHNVKVDTVNWFGCH